MQDGEEKAREVADLMQNLVVTERQQQEKEGEHVQEMQDQLQMRKTGAGGRKDEGAQDFNLLCLIAGDVIPLVTPATTATKSTTPASRLVAKTRGKTIVGRVASAINSLMRAAPIFSTLVARKGLQVQGSLRETPIFSTLAAREGLQAQGSMRATPIFSTLVAREG